MLARVFHCGGLFFSRSEAGPVKVFRFGFPAAHGPERAQDTAGTNTRALGIGPVKLPGLS